MLAYEAVRRQFAEQGQEHVFAGWEKLSPAERDALLEDCAQVDFAWLRERLAEIRGGAAGVSASETLEPDQVVGLPRDDAEKKSAATALAAGETALREGRVAAFMVAGGQGSRLGFEGPKGCFGLGPVSGRSLFQWHAEQISARSRRYGKRIPWYIMTSRDNDADTRNYFADRGYFGLPAADVFFFQQELVPSLDLSGKLLLASSGRLAMNPNGHGGSLSGLCHSGALADMRRRGVDVISYFQVDNPLVTICDPLFLGLHLTAGAEMSSKVLEKTGPDEKLGVVCRAGGRSLIVEYSDLDPGLKAARDASGRLKFWAGSIAIHALDAAFAEKVGKTGGLPWHCARKKTPYYAEGKVVRPDKENCFKFETFVFDAIPLAKRSLNLEVEREKEFAPVKNADGVDSAVSARKLVSGYFAGWLEECGWEVPRGADGFPRVDIEISPLYALDAAELKEKLGGRKERLDKPLLLERFR